MAQKINDAATVRQAARQLLEDRIAVIDELTTMQEQLVQANADYSASWARALQSGWTATELKQLQLTEPAARATPRAGRSARAPRQRTGSPAAGAASSAPATPDTPASAGAAEGTG